MLDWTLCLKTVHRVRAKGWNLNCFTGINMSAIQTGWEMTALHERWWADKKRGFRKWCRKLILDKQWLWKVVLWWNWLQKVDNKEERVERKGYKENEEGVTINFWSLPKESCILLNLREIRHFFKWQNTLLTSAWPLRIDLWLVTLLRFTPVGSCQQEPFHYK